MERDGKTIKNFIISKRERYREMINNFKILKREREREIRIRLTREKEREEERKRKIRVRLTISCFQREKWRRRKR